MRGLRKPWPPANVSPDNQPPRRFADAEREYMAALRAAPNKARFARAEFDRLDKGKLRQVMYDEQGSVCVYCESGLVENESPPHVEHWRPLSCAPDYAIHWPNLYLSCPSPETCDVSKGARRLKADDADPELPWPTNFAYERIVAYSRGGDMYVREDVHVDEETRRALELAIDDRQHAGRRCRAILNLNHPTLVAARREALDSERRRLEQDFEDRTASRDEREERASQLLGRDRLPAFVSIRVAWLRKSLGRGR